MPSVPAAPWRSLSPHGKAGPHPLALRASALPSIGLQAGLAALHAAHWWAINLASAALLPFSRSQWHASTHPPGAGPSRTRIRLWAGSCCMQVCPEPTIRSHAHRSVRERVPLWRPGAPCGVQSCGQPGACSRGLAQARTACKGAARQVGVCLRATHPTSSHQTYTHITPHFCMFTCMHHGARGKAPSRVPPALACVHAALAYVHAAPSRLLRALPLGLPYRIR